jgi:cytochrome c peroxidase
MIRWATVMGRRARGSCVLAWVLVGCWSDELADKQAAAVEAQFVVPAYDPCALSTGYLPRERCDLAADLGQALFFEPALSATGQVACVTCHDPHHGFADGRTENAVSLGAVKWTAHNTISVVNVGLKEDFGYRRIFTWTGKCASGYCTTPSDVVRDIALPRAMGSSPTVVGDTVRAFYDPEYVRIFGATPSDNAVVMNNVLVALEAYMRRLVSSDRQELDAASRRGFELFVGRAMCVECHRGPVFSDSKVHVTGVAQRGAHAPTIDNGFDDQGGFFTPQLRGVAQTAPYMHDGSLATLEEVVEFYRWGGGTSGFVGDKDMMMETLDIDDDDVRDLVAFLESLSGRPLDAALLTDRHRSP